MQCADVCNLLTCAIIPTTCAHIKGIRANAVLHQRQFKHLYQLCSLPIIRRDFCTTRFRLYSIHRRKHARTHVHTPARMHTHTHTLIYACVRVRVSACVCVCVRACICNYSSYCGFGRCISYLDCTTFRFHYYFMLRARCRAFSFDASCVILH